MGASSGIGLLGSATNVAQLQEARVIQKGAAPKKLTDEAKIDKSSQQFEAILVGTWLNEAQQSFASVPGGDTDRDVYSQLQRDNNDIILSNQAHGSGHRPCRVRHYFHARKSMLGILLPD